MKSIDLDTNTLPPILKTQLRPSYGPNIPATVVFDLAGDDPADIRTWAEKLGADVETYAPSEIVGQWMACASTEADVNGLHIEVWQAWPVPAPVMETAVAS